ncbi:fibronectin type III domain-containing protein [Methanofollis fontis]|nr:fibronectin type III domain-containing protein [Methanofollis fontis]
MRMNPPKRAITVLLLMALLIAPAPAEKVVISANIGLAITNLTVSAIGCDGATVCWETDREAVGWVDYGPLPGNYTARASGGEAPEYHHCVALPPLTPGSTVYLRAVSECATLRAASDEVAFTTAPENTGDDDTLPTVQTARTPAVPAPIEIVQTTGERVRPAPPPPTTVATEGTHGTPGSTVPVLPGVLILLFAVAALRWR